MADADLDDFYSERQVRRRETMSEQEPTYGTATAPHDRPEQELAEAKTLMPKLRQAARDLIEANDVLVGQLIALQQEHAALRKERDHYMRLWLQADKPRPAVVAVSKPPHHATYSGCINCGARVPNGSHICGPCREKCGPQEDDK